MTLQQDSSHPTGVIDTSPRGSSGATRARLRKAKAALELRKWGYTWDTIAKDLGYPTGRAALVATELALEHELDHGESADFMRKMAASRLDKLLKPVMKKALDENHPEHLAAVQQVRGIIRDHADLMGYVAPKRTVVTNPTMSQIEQWVSTVLNLQAPEVEEASIFDDVVDGEVLEDAPPAQ